MFYSIILIASASKRIFLIKSNILKIKMVAFVGLQCYASIFIFVPFLSFTCFAAVSFYFFTLLCIFFAFFLTLLCSLVMFATLIYLF